MIWLRLHTKMRHDRQLQQMPAELFRHVVNLWTLARDYGQEGELPVIADTAFELRLSEEEAESVLVKLTAMRLLVKKSGKYAVKNYTKWQYMDDSKNRVRALRERRRNDDGNGKCNGESNDISNDDGNASNAHRTEQNRTEQKTPPPSAREAEPFNGPDPTQLVRDAVEECAKVWPNIGDKRHAAASWEREAAGSAKGVAGWCTAVIGTARQHAPAHVAAKTANARHFIPTLDRWVSSGDYTNPPPMLIEAKAKTGRYELLEDDNATH